MLGHFGADGQKIGGSAGIMFWTCDVTRNQRTAAAATKDKLSASGTGR